MVGDRSKCDAGEQNQARGWNGEDPMPEGREGPVVEEGQHAQEAWSPGHAEGSGAAWEVGAPGAQRRSLSWARKGLSSTLERSHVKL